MSVAPGLSVASGARDTGRFCLAGGR